MAKSNAILWRPNNWVNICNTLAIMDLMLNWYIHKCAILALILKGIDHFCLYNKRYIIMFLFYEQFESNHVHKIIFLAVAFRMGYPEAHRFREYV